MPALFSPLPRPEYPRPRLVRPRWLCLNGPWEFAFDDADHGFARGWAAGKPLPQQIVVPFAYQYPLSGIGDTAVHERVWYARDFEIPQEWRQGDDAPDILLHFGAVDYRCTVWINGHEAGHNTGGNVPFWLDVSPYLQQGSNRVVLRVTDTLDPHQPRGKQAVSGKAKGCDYYGTTGIWQTVWLEPAPPVRVDDVKVTPLVGSDPENDALELRVTLHAPAAGWHIQAEALDGETIMARAEETDAGSSVRLTLPLPHGKRWTPDTPHLYGLKVRVLSEGKALDEVASYAGLRSAETRGGHFRLNGRPTFMAMALDQGYWPDGGMTAPTDDAIRADVEWCKRFGFNGARKHQKVEDPRWLYWCDTLGLMVWGEMANARAWSQSAEEKFAAEWERAVRRDVSHPCIVTWVPVNESWGAPDLEHGDHGQYAFIERITALTRRLDPTRPVVDNDGWEHTDVGDICAIHDYTVEPETLRARYAETLKTGQPPLLGWGTHPRAYFSHGARYRGQPIMLTEVGGLLTLPEGDPAQRDNLYNMYGFCETPEELLARYRALMEALADFPFLQGFCYTQITDIEQEINGLLTYDRRPKVAPEDVAEIHQRLFGARMGSGK